VPRDPEHKDRAAFGKRCVSREPRLRIPSVLPAWAGQREYSPALNFQVKGGTSWVAWQSQELRPAPPAQHPRSATGFSLTESGLGVHLQGAQFLLVFC